MLEITVSVLSTAQALCIGFVSTSPTLPISTKWNNTEPSVAFLGTLINLLAGTAQQVFEW